MSLTVEVAGKSDVGCVRQNNEDNFGYDSRHGIYVVCDGMGGQAAGEVASKLAVDTVLNYFREAARTGHRPQVGPAIESVSARANALASAIQLANAAIYKAAAEHAAHSGMGSTIVAVLLENGSLSVGHAGDSRIYRIREGEIQQLTRDHSLVMEQVRRGMLTQEEAQNSEMQNIIIRALGPEQTVQVDVEDLTAQSGDLLLLCSDGLNRHVSDDNIREILQGTNSLPLMADRLIDAAREGGGADNITALLVRFQDMPWYKKPFHQSGPEWQDSM
jgi:protein phosphatase